MPKGDIQNRNLKDQEKSKSLLRCPEIKLVTEFSLHIYGSTWYIQMHRFISDKSKPIPSFIFWKKWWHTTHCLLASLSHSSLSVSPAASNWPGNWCLFFVWDWMRQDVWAGASPSPTSFSSSTQWVALVVPKGTFNPLTLWVLLVWLGEKLGFQQLSSF